MAKNDLTQQQRDFCYYLVNRWPTNQTKAAIEAGYAEKSAHVAASRLLKIDKIQKEIQRLHREKHMGPDEVLAGLADIARLDMSDFARVDSSGGASLDLRKAKNAGKLGLIREIQTDVEMHESGEGDSVAKVLKTKVKLYDKQRALETLARHHGLLKDPEINININIHLELINRTWQALEEAGLDPVRTFEGLIQLAHARRIENRPGSD